MSNEEKRKKTNKGKVAFMFAFAVTVLGSRAGALSASAAVTPGDDANNDDNNNVTESARNDIGSNEAYLKCGSNVYIASEDASAVADFNNELSGYKGFAAYTKDLNMYGIHVEGNICAEKVNKFDVFNTNVAANFERNGVEAPSVYTCYIAELPQDGDSTIKLGVYEGTTYDLVFGFDFEIVEGGDASKITFNAGGRDYIIDCQGHPEKVSIRRADANDSFANIGAKLDSMAKAGQSLIDEVGFSAEDSGSSLRDAVYAIETGAVQPGQTLVASVSSNDLSANGEYLQKLLSRNGGVKVIINVITDDSTTYVDMGCVNDNGDDKINWNLSNANITFNFGNYAGDIKTSQMGGIVVAPNAHFFNDGVLSGSVFASDVRMNNEIHQVTADDGSAPSVDDEQDVTTPDEEDQDEKDQDIDKDVVQDNDDTDDGDEEDEIGGGDDDTDETTPDDDDSDDTTPDDDEEDKVEEEDKSIETDDGDTPDEPTDDTSDEPDDADDGPDDTVVDDGDDGDDVVDDSPDEPTDETPDEPTDDTPDEPTDDTPDEPKDDTPDEPTDDTPDEPTDDTPDEPTDDTPDEPTDDTPDEPTDDTPDEPTDDTPDEPVDDTPEDQVTDDVTDVEDEPDVDDDYTEDNTVDADEEDLPEDDIPDEPDTPDEPTVDETPDEPVDETPDEPTEEPVEPETPDETVVDDANDEVVDAPEDTDTPSDDTVVIDDIEMDDFDDDTEVATDSVSDENHFDDIVIIDDDDVPLADNPYTGVEDTSAGLGIGAAVALGATVAAASLKRKKKDQ